MRLSLSVCCNAADQFHEPLPLILTSLSSSHSFRLDVVVALQFLLVGAQRYLSTRKTNQTLGAPLPAYLPTNRRSSHDWLQCWTFSRDGGMRWGVRRGHTHTRGNWELDSVFSFPLRLTNSCTQSSPHHTEEFQSLFFFFNSLLEREKKLAYVKRKKGPRVERSFTLLV